MRVHVCDSPELKVPGAFTAVGMVPYEPGIPWCHVPRDAHCLVANEREVREDAGVELRVRV
eukprot:19654-Eustigmatos_ZCMA.PRE.1